MVGKMGGLIGGGGGGGCTDVAIEVDQTWGVRNYRIVSPLLLFRAISIAQPLQLLVSGSRPPPWKPICRVEAKMGPI